MNLAFSMGKALGNIEFISMNKFAQPLEENQKAKFFNILVYDHRACHPILSFAFADTIISRSSQFQHLPS